MSTRPDPAEPYGPPGVLTSNSHIAVRLEEVAQALTDQQANPYRVNAYRNAARTVRNCPQPMGQLLEEQGIAGLMRLPGIGEHLGRAIYQLATTGRLPMLERLRGESDPASTLASVPGVGRRTARRIHDNLGIHTLEELELAAHDGRLGRVGVGAKRLAGIRDALAGRLGRIDRSPALEGASVPGVDEILDVDRQYREEAQRGILPTIAPRRFNPGHEAWLPVLHSRRGERDYTALYSNTARAHELGRTHDWVVLYFDGHRGTERQCTVVTGLRGRLRGRRIVRGREDECLQYYWPHSRQAQSAGSMSSEPEPVATSPGSRALGANRDATG
jgi:DNA polymerase (family X)